MRTGMVHMGTRKRRAGWGCSKMNMARKVSMMPQKQPTRHMLKQGSSIWLYSLISLFFSKAASMSNFRQRETKMPGITMSPKPTMLVLKSPSALRQGKSILMGMSKFLATVTITSVPYTQKMSQKNRAHIRNSPVLVVLRLRLLRPTSEKRIAKMLLSDQCLVRKQNPTGRLAPIRHRILAGETSNFFISKMFWMKEGTLLLNRIRLCESVKGRYSTKIEETERTVVNEKYTLIIEVKTSLGRTLNSMQNPKRKADAMRGNRFASAMLITDSSSPRDLENVKTWPLLSLARHVESRQPMQTQQQVLMSSWREMGTMRRAPPTLARMMRRQAGTRVRMGWRLKVMSSIINRCNSRTQ